MKTSTLTFVRKWQQNMKLWIRFKQKLHTWNTFKFQMFSWRCANNHFKNNDNLRRILGTAKFLSINEITFYLVFYHSFRKKMPVKNDIPKSSIMIKLIVKTRSRMTKRKWKKKRKENGKTRNYTTHYWRARESDSATLDLCVNAWVMVPVLPSGWLENSNEHESESRIIIILLFIFAIRLFELFQVWCILLIRIGWRITSHYK